MRELKVLETNILHTSDVIYWLDGTTAESEADMLRVNYPIETTLTTRPADLQLLHTAGKTALWRRPTEPMLERAANENDLEFPNQTPFALAGTVSDPNRRYNPRAFSITVGNVSRKALVLYPTPIGTRFGSSGGLTGTLRFDGSGQPVPWAILTLVVTTALGSQLTFHAQSDQHGDFALPMNRVPPLPEGITQYSAELSIRALSSADPATPIDPADLLVMNLGELASNNVFSNPIGLAVVPGEIKLIRSMNRDHVAVQPS